MADHQPFTPEMMKLPPERKPTPFGRRVEYPSMSELLDNGLERGTWYSYVTSSYINGLLPYIEPVRAWLLRRYRIWPDDKDPTERPITDAEIAEWEKAYHTKFIDLGDNVVFVGETARHWWVIYMDCDVSDCRVGRVTKESVWTVDDVLQWVGDHLLPDKREAGGDYGVRHEIPLGAMQGWRSFC